ncbi:MAG: hypothetical protein O7D91_07940 [Planctomycetota bacterium]|nr:hypothetical protein [Planctomycetota bacterium]
MDSFESIVRTIFESQGYWVKTSFKVDLTKAEKRKIGRPSSPRWELDVVAYKGASNELLVIECKSYLDSTGVKADELMNAKPTNRYKLFNDKTLRDVVFARLLAQMVKLGLCRKNTSVRLCLAAGKIATEKDQRALAKHFKAKRWGFYPNAWIEKELRSLSRAGYEDDVAIVTTKLLTRNKR